MTLTHEQHKRSQRRHLGWLLLLAALVCALALMPLPAFAAGTAQVTVGSPEQELKAGDEFTVEVNLQDNPGFAAASFAVSYDARALELAGIDGSGGILGDAMLASVETGTVGYLKFSGDNDANGLLFNLTFKVRDSAETGDYSIAVALKDGLEQNLVNSEAQTVAASFSSGTANVNGLPPGSTEDPDNPDNPGEGTPGTGTGTTPGTTTPQPPKDSNGKDVTNTVDVHAPSTSAPKQAEVGSSVFVNAEQGTLSWDASMFDGYYDSDAGGYILTPKAPGSSELTYRDADGAEKSIAIEISEPNAPASAPGFNMLIVIAIIAAAVIAAVIVFVLLRRKNVSRAHSAKSEPVQGR